MASLVLRSAGRALRRSPVSDFVGKTQSSKYSTSSSGLQVNRESYQGLGAKVDELTRVLGGLKKGVKELELVLEKKDATVRRQAPFKMLAGVTIGFALGFYTNQHLSA
ncbi:uncharacterized protein [Lolium perenne]|uniref:uncharacterized protein n=1 Tax=Lolium perenne TaxID=4522 RepID=UPI0021F50A12|nr:uncharacterized protein LOC127347431 [Lolium perenne]